MCRHYLNTDFDFTDANGIYDPKRLAEYNDRLQRDSYHKDSLNPNSIRFDGQEERIAYSLGSAGFGNVRNFRSDGSEILQAPDLSEELHKQHQERLTQFNESPARKRIRERLARTMGKAESGVSESEIDSWIQSTLSNDGTKARVDSYTRVYGYRTDAMATVVYEVDGREVSVDEYLRLTGGA